MTCRSNVKLDADLAELQRFADGLVTPELQAAWNGCPSAPPMPLVLLGPGGDYVRPMNESQIGEVFFPSRGGKLVLSNAHIARIGIADDAVVIRNAAPGLEVDWNIPAAVGEAAQAIEQKVKWGVGVVEAFCAGCACGLVGLTLALWLVM